MREPAADDQLSFQVLRPLRRILRQVSAWSRKVGRDTGLSVPALLCMRAIRGDEADEVTVARVADAVQLSRPTVSLMVEKLVRAGLVDRVRGDRDRRRVHLSLTEEGRARIAQMPNPLEDRFLARLGGLDPCQRQRVVEALELVADLMDQND